MCASSRESGPRSKEQLTEKERTLLYAALRLAAAVRIVGFNPTDQNQDEMYVFAQQGLDPLVNELQEIHARDQTLRKLTRDLLPLLNRIKSDSIILSGFYHFVENIDYPEQYIIPLPNPVKKTKGSALSKNFNNP